jgi:hypothetical protein
MTPIGLAPPPTGPELHDSVEAEPVAEGRSVLPAPTRRSLPQRFVGPPLWISLGAHLLLLAGLLLYVRFGPEMTPLGRPGSEQTVQYVDLVDPTQLDAGEAAPATSPQEPAAAAPAEVGAAPPGGVPRVITSQGGEAAVPAEAPAEGGGGGVAERLRPGFSDARLYADPEIARMRQPGISDTERYRRHFQARIDALNDSLYGSSGPNTDWTVKDGSGNRWGISEEGIHLGPLRIPRALVPFPPASGTNQDLEQDREQRRQREEIDRQEADREVRRARDESNAAARERREEEQRGGDDPGP